MVGLISEKCKNSENGFLLLDSLVSLTVIMTIILFLNPLITNWLSQRQKAKDLVEDSRLIYEESMEINNQQREGYSHIRNNFQSENLQEKMKETGQGVFIYESKFEYE